jgi:aspartyl-tRNA synthetase
LFQQRTHTCGQLTKEDTGKKVVLNGWVDRIRNLGGLIFVLVRDRYGKTQVVFDPNDNKEVYERSLELKNEFVVSITGVVRTRPEKDINLGMKTGEIEVLATQLEIISESEVPPIYINKDEDVSENLRLKYRYLDLRKEKMQKNLIIRHQVMKATRDYLSSQNFLEIETPYLTKSTPEGARDFLVPSRLKPGTFYALPQSPQLFKQLLMVAGFDRYFQIARCFRDEDFRADRQPEFTQIDIEASFIKREDIFNVTEQLIKDIFQKTINEKIVVPFRRYTYDDVMNKYGSDKPDTRYGMEFIELSNYFEETEAKFIKEELANGSVLKGFIIPEKAENFARSKFDELVEYVKSLGSSGMIWISLTNSGDIRSNIKKIAEREIRKLIENDIIKKNSVMLMILGDTTYFKYGNYNIFNLPRIDFVSLDFPTFSYLSYKKGSFDFLIGRIPLSYGPMKYNLVLSDNSPYYDTMNISYSFSDNLSYDFAILSMVPQLSKNEQEKMEEKYIASRNAFYNGINYKFNENLFFGLSSLNQVAGKLPNPINIFVKSDVGIYGGYLKLIPFYDINFNGEYAINYNTLKSSYGLGVSKTFRTKSSRFKVGYERYWIEDNFFSNEKPYQNLYYLLLFDEVHRLFLERRFYLYLLWRSHHIFFQRFP